MSSKYVKGVVKSTWTPLNNEDNNVKVFEERRSLVNKWFEMWTTNQRKIILEDLLINCTGSQVEYAKHILSTKAIQNHVDFTRILPRVICLYIFSFLDPRSLCRASQSCWYWKYLAEANEIWAPKCARLGWYFTGPINSMETGLWKKHFIENIIFLQITRPAKELSALELSKKAEKEEALRKARKYKEKQLLSQKPNSAPWRGPDPKPLDIVRNNYIDNDIDNGARVKVLNQKSNYKTKRYSNNESHTIGKDKWQSTQSSRNDDHIIIPTTPTIKMEIIDDVKLHHSLPVESIIRPPPVNVIENGHNKSNIVKHVESNKEESQDDTEIPSGRPWIIPIDQDEL